MKKGEPMKKELIIIAFIGVCMIVLLTGCTAPKDTDNDGYTNDVDVFPQNPHEWADADNDSIGDNTDAFPQNSSEWKDTDADGYGDNSDDFPTNEDIHEKELIVSESLMINGTASGATYAGNGRLSSNAKYLACDCVLQANETLPYPINVTIYYHRSSDDYVHNTFFMTTGYTASIQFPVTITDDQFLGLTIESSNFPGSIGAPFTITYTMYQFN